MSEQKATVERLGTSGGVAAHSALQKRDELMQCEKDATGTRQHGIHSLSESREQQ